MKTELLGISEIKQYCELHKENLILNMKTLEILFQLFLDFIQDSWTWHVISDLY